MGVTCSKTWQDHCHTAPHTPGCTSCRGWTQRRAGRQQPTCPEQVEKGERKKTATNHVLYKRWSSIERKHQPPCPVQEKKQERKIQQLPYPSQKEKQERKNIGNSKPYTAQEERLKNNHRGQLKRRSRTQIMQLQQRAAQDNKQERKNTGTFLPCLRAKLWNGGTMGSGKQERHTKKLPSPSQDEKQERNVLHKRQSTKRKTQKPWCPAH